MRSTRFPRPGAVAALTAALAYLALVPHGPEAPVAGALAACLLVLPLERRLRGHPRRTGWERSHPRARSLAADWLGARPNPAPRPDPRLHRLRVDVRALASSLRGSVPARG